jgi:CPA2 family monovalent cation:H+ antiporter-2
MLIVGYFFKIPQTGIILMTFCVTLSSTAVTVKSLNLLRNLDVDIREQTFGILIAQDIIALFMVLIVDFMGFKQRSEGDIYKIIAILVFIAIVFLAFLRLPRYAHKLALLIRKHKEMLTMFVFGVCLGSALFAEVVGLSASCGAFISGLLFGNSGIKEEVKNVTLPIEELLLMTFFLSIGLLVDINFIAKNLPIIFAGLLFVAFGKTIINILVMRLCKFSLKESFVMGVLLGHIGEFSFMLSHTANKAGIINIYGEKFLISLTALSLFLSPFWLVFAERCRTLAENTHVNSWAFFRLALDREIQKTRYITTTIKSGCATQLRYLWDKLMDIAEMLKRK